MEAEKLEGKQDTEDAARAFFHGMENGSPASPPLCRREPFR